MKRIGEVVKELAISADTLLYYEKIELMPRVQRNSAGVRMYSERDLSKLRFIKRAQKMKFSLDEIAELLIFRAEPQRAKPHIRALAHRKLDDIEQHLEELTILYNELRLLTNLCTDVSEGCPILDSFED